MRLLAGPEPKGEAAAVRDGRPVSLRPVRAEDAELVQSFVRALSPQSRRNRFFSGLGELSHHMLRRLTQPAYPEEFGLVALAGGPGARKVVGMAQYAPDGGSRAEFGVVVADAWQRQGLATWLIQALSNHAGRFGYRTLHAVMLAENRAILALARRLGFRVFAHPDPALVQIEKPLAGVPQARQGSWPSSRLSH